jgi:hypothetical protein
VVLPFKEVCGGKGLIDKCPPSSLLSDHAGHNIFGPLSGEFAGWHLGGRLGPYWDCSNVPGWTEGPVL